MFKKLAIVAGVLIIGFVGMLTMFGGLMLWALDSGSKHQERFFTAVASGDAQQVIALFHPALKEEVDEPVLALWMSRVRSDLGAFKGLSLTNFNTSSKFDNGASLVESKGTVEFEHGSAKSELVFRDGQLVKWLVTSDKIPADWINGPLDSKLYRQRGETFISYFLQGKPDAAFAVMHPALQKAVPLDQLKAMVERVNEGAGPMKSVTFLSDRFDTSATPTLKIFYKIECEKDQSTAEVDFQFEGLKGGLVLFNLSVKEE
jgi:hypothetical protein